MIERFHVVYLSDADAFLSTLPHKVREKILFNIRKAKYITDPKLFKKLEGTDIWEFRTKYGGMEYRLLAFWDKGRQTLVVATNGFVKKTQKTPMREIDRAVQLKNLYFKTKDSL